MTAKMWILESRTDKFMQNHHEQMKDKVGIVAYAKAYGYIIIAVDILTSSRDVLWS